MLKMYVSRCVLLLTILIPFESITSLVFSKRENEFDSLQYFESFKETEKSIKDDRSDDEIVTVTAKIWYVSDYLGKYRETLGYQKVDENCVDDEDADELCNRIITKAKDYEMFSEAKRKAWGGDSPKIRAQAVVDKNLDYMNMALANSEIPIRYVQWGSVQDIGKTEEQIGSGYIGPGGPAATRSAEDVFESMKTIFGDDEAGRERLYQSADVVILMVNYAMISDHLGDGKNSGMLYGRCTSSLYGPEVKGDHRFVVLASTYGSEWLFAHEVGHCLGGMHLKPPGYVGTRTNFAYCPPEGEFGTIESYTTSCANGPSGEYRKKVPYWSNPNVNFQGVATGTESQNNAKYMTEKRFESAAAGSNCLDGNPDEAWMNGDDSGKIGNNCQNGEASYKPLLSDSLVNCEYSEWTKWSSCDKACGRGSQTRSRDATRQAWYGGIKCSEEDSNDQKVCNEDECPVCDDPKQLYSSSFVCEASKDFGTPCTNLFDGDESTVWVSGFNKAPDKSDPRYYVDGKFQWGLNANIKIIFSKETIVSGVQIINKVNQTDFYENYKTMELQFSNPYTKEIRLANRKENKAMNLENPVQTSFVNFVGLTTWGQMPDNHWICSGVYPYCKGMTGFRSGLSEIRVFGCAEGNIDEGVDGGWSEWGSWTECSTACGPGTMSRTRSCTSPKPTGSRRPCQGEDSENRECEKAACEGDICFEVSLTSTSWARENSWVIGTCSSTTAHENHKTHKEECCLPSGQYTLECKDSVGDGWKGGYIMIDGKTYCESFYGGKLETHEVLIGSDTDQEEGDDEWISGKRCKGWTLATVFEGKLGKKVDIAKKDCSAACDMRDDCKFASLYWKPSSQACKLHGKVEKGYCKKFEDHSSYRLYIKQ